MKRVKLICCGNHVFIIKYLGRELAIIEDENGNERCVNVKNIREEA